MQARPAPCVKPHFACVPPRGGQQRVGKPESRRCARENRVFGYQRLLSRCVPPYVIAPLVGDLDNTADDREASVVKVAAEGVRLSLSLDNGMIWQKFAGAGGTFDLTPWISGRYGYLLKIDLLSEKAVVRSLEITTWVQVHPASSRATNPPPAALSTPPPAPSPSRPT